MLEEKNDLVATRECIKHWVLDILRPLRKDKTIKRGSIKDPGLGATSLFWEETERKVPIAVGDCALCKIYYRDSCRGCPLYLATGWKCSEHRSAYIQFRVRPTVNNAKKMVSDLVDTYKYLRREIMSIHTIDTLAEALYEGSPSLQNLAEILARQYGNAGALSYFSLMSQEVKFFWKDIARQIIEHSKEWEENRGGACILSKKESQRLYNLMNEKKQSR